MDGPQGRRLDRCVSLLEAYFGVEHNEEVGGFLEVAARVVTALAARVVAIERSQVDAALLEHAGEVVVAYTCTKTLPGVFRSGRIGAGEFGEVGRA